MNIAVDYLAMAEMHKPKDADGIRIAAMELARNGLSDHDIGHVLKLDVNSIRQLLGRCGDCE